MSSGKAWHRRWTSDSVKKAERLGGQRMPHLLLLLGIFAAAIVWASASNGGGHHHIRSLQQQQQQHLQASRSGSTKPPLVFAAADGLHAADAAVFVGSAFKYLGQDARIVLACDPLKPANEHLYELQRQHDRLTVLNVSMSEMTIPCNNGTVPLSVYLSRFAILRDYLAAEGSRYSVVLSADARDTAFQGDVFARPVVQAAQHEPMVIIGTEDTPQGAGFVDQSITLAEEAAWNQKWLNACFGPNSYDPRQRRSIMCSGFMVGHTGAMQQLAQTVVSVFRDTCCHAEQRGIDQGIINWLTHYAPPEAKRGFRLEAAHNGDPVFSMANTAYMNQLTYSPEHLVVHAYTQQPYTVIHQFDRVPPYVPVIRQLYQPAAAAASSSAAAGGDGIVAGSSTVVAGDVPPSPGQQQEQQPQLASRRMAQQ